MARDTDDPAPHVRCRDCGKFRPCGCDSKEWARDKAAAAFAKQSGAAIPGPTHARPFGGELERTDRRTPQEVIGAFVARRTDRSEMRAHLDEIQARLAHVRKVAAQAPYELAVLKVEEIALRMHVEGATFPEISRALGRVSHSHASGIMKRIRAEARGDGQRVVVLPCACGRAWCLVPQRAGRGRPRRWASEKCRRMACENARRNSRSAAGAKSRVRISAQSTAGRGRA